MINKRLTVLVHPEDRSNPYFKLLETNIRSENITYKYLFPTLIRNHAFMLGIPYAFISTLYYRFALTNVFHLHWTTPFFIPRKGIIWKIISFVYALIFIYWLKILRYKIIWTAHDLLPHNTETINDYLLRKIIFNISASKIFLTKSSKAVAEKYNFNCTNSYVIPHGNFIGYYPGNTSKKIARQMLALKQNSFIYAFIGRIEPYKGVPDLLKSFRSIRNRNLEMIIAGKKSDNIDISDYYLDKNIHIKLGYIRDDEISLYLNAVDVMVLPFKNVTNSSSILLAASFGLPVIAPYLGSIKELSSNTGFYYNPSKINSLGDAMIDAYEYRKQLKTYSKNILTYANLFSWKRIAHMTAEVYTGV